MRRNTAHHCEECGAIARTEYALMLSGGAGRTAPATMNAWLCSSRCASAYFGEPVEA